MKTKASKRMSVKRSHKRKPSTVVRVQKKVDEAVLRQRRREQEIAAMRQTGVIPAGTPENVVDLFYRCITEMNLSPYRRQIHLIPRRARIPGTDRYEMRYTIQTGIDGFRAISSRNKRYVGQAGPEWCGPDGVWHSVWVKEEPPVAARVGVLMAGNPLPFWGVAKWAEYCPQNEKDAFMWKRLPTTMLAKCAEAQAHRKANPDDLSNVYLHEEMEQAGDEVKTKTTVGEEQVNDILSQTEVRQLPAAQVIPESKEAEQVVEEITHQFSLVYPEILAGIATKEQREHIKKLLRRAFGVQRWDDMKSLPIDKLTAGLEALKADVALIIATKQEVTQ